MIMQSLSKQSENVWVPQRQSANFRLRVSSWTNERWSEAFDTLHIIPHGRRLAFQVRSTFHSNLPENFNISMNFSDP